MAKKVIGQIKLHDAFSLVDLPADLPRETMRLLQDVWVGVKG